MFKSIIAQSSANLVDKLTGELAEQEQAVSRCQLDYDARAANAVSTGDWKAADAAHEVLLAAQRTRDRTGRMLTAAKQRQDNDAKDAERSAINAAWKAAATIANDREKLAAKLMASFAEFAADYKATQASTQALSAAIPHGQGLASHQRDSMLGHALFELMRIEYTRAGLPGGPPLMGADPKPLAEYFAESARTVRNARADAMGTFAAVPVAA